MYIHPSATIDEGAQIGQGTKVWHLAHVRGGAKIGEDCIIGRGCYVDSSSGLRTKRCIGTENEPAPELSESPNDLRLTTRSRSPRGSS